MHKAGPVFAMCLNNNKHGSKERGKGSPDPPPPLKNQKRIGFLSNTGPDPLKNHKVSKLTFNVGQSSATSETPFQWRVAGGPIMACS